MNFQNLMGSDCGEDNSLAQFAQHMVQDVARQDSVGQPSTSSGLVQNNVMPPQSFRMRNLMNEMEAIQPQRSYMPLLTSSPDSQPTMEYPASRGYMNMMYPSEQSLWNIALSSPPVFWSPYPQYNFHPQFRELSEYSEDESGIVVNSLDQLSDMSQYIEYQSSESKAQQLEQQLEEVSGNLRNRSEIAVDSLDQPDHTSQRKEQKNQPLETPVQQDTEPKPMSYWRGIPIYDDKLLRDMLAVTTEPHTFFLSLKEYGKRCDEEWKLKNPNHKSEINKSEIREDHRLEQQKVNKCIVHKTECPYIINNPMRGCDDPMTNSKRQLSMGKLNTAILYADEAVRKNPKNIYRWMFLQNLYDKIEVKNHTTFSVAKQILLLDPTHINSYLTIASYHIQQRCYYEMFKTIVLWLKNHKSYGNIPLNFSMAENSTLPNRNSTWIQSNQHIFDGVKNVLFTAARRNPTNPDPVVQVFLSHIFAFNMEFNKSADCLETILKCIPRDLRQPQLYYNVGLNFFLCNNPYKALNYLLDGLEISENKIKVLTCRLIGIIQLYLTNYREAIRYFREALDIDPSDEEFALPTRGGSLEVENELCLLLYFKLHKKLFSK